MREINGQSAYLSVKEVSAYLGVSTKTILNYIKYEGLKATKFKKYGPYRILETDLLEWIQDHEARTQKESEHDG